MKYFKKFNKKGNMSLDFYKLVNENVHFSTNAIFRIISSLFRKFSKMFENIRK